MANKEDKKDKKDKKDPRYNWIHIPENYFDRVKTKIIRNTENGDTKIVLYFKMLDAVKNTDGYYLFQYATQSISEEIAIQINEDAELVKATLDTLSNLGLAEIEEEGCYFNESEQFVGTILESTLRVQEWRAKEKAQKIREAKQNVTHCNDTQQTNVTSETSSNDTKQGNATNETACNNSMLQGKQTNVTSETECNTEKEREKEEDKEIDKEINNNCANSKMPNDIDDVINLFKDTCKSLTIIESVEDYPKELSGKLGRCLSTKLTMTDYKNFFIDAEKNKDRIKESTKNKQYSCDFETTLEMLMIIAEQRNKATA